MEDNRASDGQTQEEVKRMYCQQCGAEVGAARFCRKCGTPVSNGTPYTQSAPSAAPVNYEKGFKKLFMGIAFLVIAIFPIFTGAGFWWWMLFPAVPLLAAGLGELVRARQTASALPPARVATLSADAPQMRSNPLPNELPRSRNTAELAPPPSSVTEGSTRLLDNERARRD